MGFFKFIGKSIKVIFFIALLVIMVGAALLYTYGRGIEKASIEDFQIDEITEFTLDSFTLQGRILVNNPSQLSIPIKSITYDLILEEYREKISSGSIPEFTLEKTTISTIPFYQEVKWVPSTNLILSLITKDEVFLIIKGQARMNIPKIEDYAIPFQTKVDIKPYVQNLADQYVSRDTQNAIKDVVNATEPYIRDTLPVVQDIAKDNEPLIRDAINQTAPYVQDYLK